MPEVPPKADERAATQRLMALRPGGGIHLTLAMAIPLVSGGLLVLQAALLANVLGQTIQQNVPLATVTPIIFSIAVLIAVRAILGVTADQFGQIGAERIKRSLRQDLFRAVLDRRATLGLAPASGAVSAAITDQVEALESFFARYLPAMIGAAVLPVAFAVILFPIDWIVALLFLISAPLIPVFMALAGWGAQAATDRQAKALATLSAHFADRLRGLLTLKLFGQSDAATTAVHTASEALRRRTNAVLRIAFLSSAILEFFAALGVAGVALYVGLTFLGFLPVNPGLTLTGGMFALIIAPEVYNPLRQLAAHYHDRARAKSALAEIETQIARADAPERSTPATPAYEPKGPAALEIEGLTVRTQAGLTILDGLDLALAPGEHLAIMGQSGIGKSTLARAITRLIGHEGTIALDGRPLADIEERVLRRRVAFIAQKPRLFYGTIADNIAFASPDATPDRIAEAAQRACVTAFATDLDATVGEGGAGLSGGQIQRIALARLFMTDPGLILLDEPTAHLDPETEARVLDAIFGFAQHRTLILSTHARDVANRAGRIVTLAGGRLLPTAHRRVAANESHKGHGA